MPHACFVSDLHITDPDSEAALLFERFLASLADEGETTHLFLMGDVFDLWVADHDYFLDRYERIVDQVRRLREAGTEIHYFEGNHDLHLERFWAEQLGARVHPGPVELELGPLQLRLEHGDQMDPNDRGYRFLRWFLRTPPVRFALCHLPGSLVARIGDRASATSREYTSRTKTIEQDQAIAVIRNHARRVYARRPFDLIISGHVHVRDDYRAPEEDGGYRSINLGTWLDRPCFLRIEGETVEWHELEPGGAAPLSRPETGEPTADGACDRQREVAS